ncbi:MAG: hypothetical protein HY821_14295 [Acidobacteria bacterium]|nr:hypothetical protein [Acidobacteriota bacterium]
MEITRRDAIGMTVGAAASAAAADEGQEMFLRLMKANDDAVGRMAQATRGRLGRGGNIGALVSAYCSPESSYYRAEKLIPLMERGAQAFVDAQDANGLLDAGNLSSPPDTAFVVEALAGSLTVARRLQDPKLRRFEETLTRFLKKTGEGLVTGGVHTPNHRWVICSALARIHALMPDQRYVDRIDDWLGEGIYQDEDGQFPERSPNYARVEADAFVTLARILKRPALLEPVRRCLTAHLYLMQPDGEMETVHSRRQDQDRPVPAAYFYLQYRYMAIHDRNTEYAAVARLIAARPGEGFVEGTNPVLQFLEEPLLRRALPEGGAAPADYSRVFRNSRMVRVRKGERSATVFGGEDVPAVMASGISHNPTFFNYRKGKAVLESVRMGGQFFNLGVFRAERFEHTGERTALAQRFEAPYYQPLPKQYRNARGDYALTPAKDGRFWSKLDFPHRAMSNVVALEQKVTVAQIEGGFELRFEITERARVPYTVELSFRPGGRFSGGIESSLLKGGMGTYRVGEDAIEFGPGVAEHTMTMVAGLRAAGECIYITGYTPFVRTITIKGV